MTRPPPCPPAADLLDHLRDEEFLLRETLASLTELNAGLRAGDLAAVAAARPRQEALAAALAGRNVTRAAVAARLADDLGLPPGTPLTLACLADHLPDEVGADLLAARTRFAALARGIADYQRRNAILVRHLRSYFRGVMAVLAAADAPTRYGPSGSCLAPAGRGAILARG